MNILTRKCDVCYTRHDNDSGEYFLFGRLEDCNGAQRDVCGTCIERLHAAALPDRAASHVPAAA